MHLTHKLSRREKNPLLWKLCVVLSCFELSALHKRTHVNNYRGNHLNWASSLQTCPSQPISDCSSDSKSTLFTTLCFLFGKLMKTISHEDVTFLQLAIVLLWCESWISAYSRVQRCLHVMKESLKLVINGIAEGNYFISRSWFVFMLAYFMVRLSSASQHYIRASLRILTAVWAQNLCNNSCRNLKAKHPVSTTAYQLIGVCNMNISQSLIFTLPLLIGDSLTSLTSVSQETLIDQTIYFFQLYNLNLKHKTCYYRRENVGVLI